MRGAAGIKGVVSRPLGGVGTAEAAGLDGVGNPGGSPEEFDVFLAHFLVEDAVEEEDEEALERVEDGKDVGHEDVLFVDEEEARDPGQAEEDDEDGRPFDPGGDAHGAATLMLLPAAASFEGTLVADAVFVADGDVFGRRHGRVTDAGVFTHLRECVPGWEPREL